MAEAGIRGPADISTANLATLPKVGTVRAGRLLSSFLAAAPVYEVVELLVPAALDPRLASRLHDQLGPPAARLLREDPWLLLGLPGVTIADADQLARTAIPGVTRDDLRRARALVGFLLAREARDGHTVIPRSDIEAALLPFAAGEPGAAVDAAVAHGSVIPAGHDDQEVLGLARYAQAEAGIAQGIARLLAAGRPIEVDVATDAFDLDEAQRSAVEYALRAGVSVLTGGPGTGKSRTVAALVALTERAGRSVALAAPTGRAAKRLEELCSAPASTLHRLLGAQPRTRGEEVSFTGGFARNREWPLDEDVVVVDEASMLDVELANALLAACSDRHASALRR